MVILTTKSAEYFEQMILVHSRSWLFQKVKIRLLILKANIHVHFAIKFL